MSKAAKLLITLATSEQGKKVIKGILIILLTPIVLALVAFISISDGASKHNNQVIDTVFNNGPLPVNAPVEYVQSILTLQSTFKDIDTAINSLENVQGKFDDTFIKVILFTHYLETEDINVLTTLDIPEYLNIFYNIEFREVENEDDLVEIAFKVPIRSTEESLSRAETFFTTDFSNTRDQLMEIYYVALTGQHKELDKSAPLESLLKDAYDHSESTDFYGGEFSNLFDDEWRNYVTSEFGPRVPITLPDGTTTGNFHYGIDFGKEKGTPIYAPANGEVVLVMYTNSGFGFYSVIDHGGGILTLYAHMSRIHVSLGDKINVGDVIGEVGTTGASTGNHLHLEFIVNRKRVNPRVYLK